MLHAVQAQMQDAMQKAMQKAGFVGVEAVGKVVFARTDAAFPEFTASEYGPNWRFEIQWPVRATTAQRALWNTLHPNAPLDVDLGETRMQFTAAAADLALWAALVDEMAISCIRWRRETRQMDEGM